jgi:hypothetical protein
MKIKQMFAATAALALVAGGPAFAAKSQDRDSVASDSGGSGAKAKEERKICKMFDSTESRMKREKVCLTREGWREFERKQSE